MAPVARSAAGYVNPNWHRLVEALDDPTQREEAWAEFAVHIEALAGAVLARENAPVEAADLAQDVMLKLQDPLKLRMLRSTERPGGYLAVLLRNAIRDAVRRRGREERAWFNAPAGERTQPDPVDRIALNALVKALRPQDQQLIRLRYMDDLTVPEIARRTGLSESAVSVRLVRLIALLRLRNQ